MELNTIIFDMDGLLIDSEPLWNEAADELLKKYGKRLTPEEYGRTTGLRTKEFLECWFTHFNIPQAHIAEATKEIIGRVIGLVKQKGKPMPGVPYIFDFFAKRGFRIGLASSSPPELIDVVTAMLGIGKYLQATTSANELNFGKPHPEVYLDCAVALNALPGQCICFEDSFNGMIAAKAARMKCVIIPATPDYKKNIWEAADLKLASLEDFNELTLAGLKGL